MRRGSGAPSRSSAVVWSLDVSEQVSSRPCLGRRGIGDGLAAIRVRVSAYLERTGMPEGEFGKRALARPEFVEPLAVQRTMTLKTADRLLGFLDEAPIGPVFRREVEAFLDVTGIRAMKFGTDAAGYPWFVDSLSDGAMTRLSAVERVRAWMVDAATPSERAMIAQMLKDTGSTTFIHGASTVLQDERPQGKTSPASEADQAAGKYPPEYDRQVFLTRHEAASFLRIGVRKLERLRAVGEGPACCKFGRQVFYARADLLTWAWTQRVNARESN